jgi:hypothetical protein
MKKPSKMLQQNEHFLKVLPKVYKKYGIKACKQISCCQMKCLSEIVRNLAKGNIPISDIDKYAFAKYKKQIKQLGRKKTPVGIKRKVLRQVGNGLLPILISAVLPLVLEFISKNK